MSSALPTSAPSPHKTPVRSIILLAAAGFASQAQIRVTDSLLPQIAADFHTTVGVAAIVLTTYAITHGSIQFVAGPVADRFGKYRTVAIASAVAAVLVAMCGTVSSLPQLAVARLATGAVASWVIPVSMAYVGDVTPADRLQPILARYASGYILGQLFGQAAGGVLGDLFGWRNVFFALAGLFAVAAAGLIFELIADPQTRKADHHAASRRGFMADYAALFSNPFARMILIVGFIEGALAWGAFAYIGANLHLRFDLSFTLVGLTVACFGVGGLIYSGLVRLLVYRLGQTGLTVIGGFLISAAYIVLAFQPAWWFAPLAVTIDWARLLHVPQHLADQSHADDAASAQHCRRDLLVCALLRTNGRRRRGRAGDRSPRAPRRYFLAPPSRFRRSPSGSRTNCAGASL